MGEREICMIFNYYTFIFFNYYTCTRTHAHAQGLFGNLRYALK